MKEKIYPDSLPGKVLLCARCMTKKALHYHKVKGKSYDLESCCGECCLEIKKPKRPKIRVTNGDVLLTRDFLRQFDFTLDQKHKSYPKWAKGASGWNPFRQGGTYIMKALCWYHHVHKPGSNEWRPSIIIRAVLREARKPRPITNNQEET